MYLRVWNLPRSTDAQDYFDVLGESFEVVKESKSRGTLIIVVGKKKVDAVIRKHNNTLFKGRYVGLRLEDDQTPPEKAPEKPKKETPEPKKKQKSTKKKADAAPKKEKQEAAKTPEKKKKTDRRNKTQSKFEKMIPYSQDQKYRSTRDDDVCNEVREIHFKTDGTYSCHVEGFRKKSGKDGEDGKKYTQEELGRYSKIARGGVDLFKNNGRFRGTIEFYKERATVLRGICLFPSGSED